MRNGNQKGTRVPPFRHLIRHLFRGRSLEKNIIRISGKKGDSFSGIEIRGPAILIEKLRLLSDPSLFLTSSISICLKNLERLRNQFPLDPEVHDTLDVDAQQMS